MLENFEVIAIGAKQKCASTLSLRGSRMIFNSVTAAILGNCRYVRPLINAADHEFAIQVCEESDENAIPFTSKAGNYALFIQQSAVMNAIRGVMGWSASVAYKMPGWFLPDENGIIYCMDEAKDVTRVKQED